LIYGIHWMLNVVTGPVGYPAAVLIRGTQEISGPGRICSRCQIDKSFNSKPAAKQTGLWFEERPIAIPKKKIISTPRIGVDYAGVWAQKPYRFTLQE
jgi:DNA-3-methyladenine glycosylase